MPTHRVCGTAARAAGLGLGSKAPNRSAGCPSAAPVGAGRPIADSAAPLVAATTDRAQAKVASVFHIDHLFSRLPPDADHAKHTLNASYQSRHRQADDVRALEDKAFLLIGDHEEAICPHALRALLTNSGLAIAGTIMAIIDHFRMPSDAIALPTTAASRRVVRG
jgi:hypothetical protein